jgi:hypothetical protein
VMGYFRNLEIIDGRRNIFGNSSVQTKPAEQCKFEDAIESSGRGAND